MTDALVTKQDLLELELRLQERFESRFCSKQDLREVEARLQTTLADLERRMTVRLGGMLVAGIGIVSAIVKLP